MGNAIRMRKSAKKNNDKQGIEGRMQMIEKSHEAFQGDLKTVHLGMDDALNNLKLQLNEFDGLMQQMVEKLNDVEQRSKETENLFQSIATDMNKSFEATKPREKYGNGNVCFVFNIESILNAPKLTVCSQKVKVAGARWFLEVKKLERGDANYLGVYLQCEPMLLGTSYDTNYTICLLGAKASEKVSFKSCFKGTIGYGRHKFLSWERFSDYSNEYIDKNGNAMLHASLSLVGASEIAKGEIDKFSSSLESDCVLLIENRRVVVNKGILSAYSPYFKTMFYGGFEEQNKNEIELKEVLAAEFLLLRDAIYSLRLDEYITGDNVEVLLRMSDMFHIDIVTETCEAFLMKNNASTISNEMKLVLAQDYGLINLEDSCLKQYKTWEDLSILKASKEYSMLNNVTKGLLFDKIPSS